MSNTQKIKATPANRKVLRQHAREAMAKQSYVKTWLLLNGEGELWILTEPQGQGVYVGEDTVVTWTGSFYKYHGDGAASYYSVNAGKELPYRTQRHYLMDLLGRGEYERIFTR